MAVRTERSEVRTKTTEGQYSPVRLEQARLVSSLLYGTRVMLVSKLPAFENKKYTSYDHFHGNDPYGKIPTKKEPIRTPGFTPRLPCHIIIVSILQSFLHFLKAKCIDNCLKHRKQFPIATGENKFQSSEILCKHRQNLIISFISPVLSSVSYEVQHLFSTFGVARNDFFREDI